MKPSARCLCTSLAIALIALFLTGSPTVACDEHAACICPHATSCKDSRSADSGEAAAPAVAASAQRPSVVPAIALTPDENRVYHYLLNAYYNEGRVAFSARDILKKTRVALTSEVKGHVLAAIYSEFFRMPLDEAELAILAGCEACPSAGDIVLPSETETERIRADLQQDGKRLVDFEAPDFQLRDLNGRKVGLGSFQGRPLALAFWSPSCAPSLRALAELDEIRQRFTDRGLAVLAVVFSDEEEQELRRVVEEEALGLRVLVSRDGHIRVAYQANLVPTVVLIDREGQMVKRLVGFKDPSVLEAEIAGLF